MEEKKDQESIESVNKNNLEEEAKEKEDKRVLAEKAEKMGTGYLEKRPSGVASGVIGIIPRDVSLKYKMVAFEREGNVLKVALVDPQDLGALNTLRFIAEKEGFTIKPYLISQAVFEDIFSLYDGPSEVVKAAVKSFKEDSGFDLDEFSPEKIAERDAARNKSRQEVLQDAPVAKLVQVIISHAIEGKASDIHIEPASSEYRVRFRVDGILHVSLLLPKEIGPVVISRIKILANLKIDEKRKPQDGRFRLTSDGKEIDFRVSTLPVINGEKVVMRILDKDSGLTDLEHLGVSGSAIDNLKSAIKETYGMILMTGPTGSGKSTTLYALLKILNQEERNIITLEDPVEYNIEGLNQSQVKPEIGYTFASGLRTVLRQDPNVIMVGEIRDGETAELAVHAALTGHLMFSTLHTNTALGAIPRLIDMGIEPFLLSSSLRMVMSQRLARRICDHCREEKVLSETIKNKMSEVLKGVNQNEFKKYGIDIEKGIKAYQGRGCEKCNGTGLKGRVAIYEVIPISDKMRNIISDNNGEDSLLMAERQRLGVLTMKQDGIMKIIKGLTTIEEIERVTEGNITLEDENL